MASRTAFLCQVGTLSFRKIPLVALFALSNALCKRQNTPFIGPCPPRSPPVRLKVCVLGSRRKGPESGWG